MEVNKDFIHRNSRDKKGGKDSKEDVSQKDLLRKETQVINSILNALNDENIEPELKVKMQAWFLGDFEDNPAKQEAFVGYAGKIEPASGKLEGNDLERYNKLVAKLGIGHFPVKENVIPLKRRFVTTMWRVAAVLLPVVTVVGLWLASRHVKPESPEMMITMSNQTQSVVLPDSSFVSVSPGSTVLYFEDGEGLRKVDLNGEAMFLVRKTEGKSFSVSTKNMTVNVSGTDFVVSEYTGSTKGVVELFAGSVDVETNGINTFLSRGEMLTYDTNSQGIEIDVIPASRMIQKGYKPRLKFNRATFSEVIVALSAFHEVEIEVAPGINTDTGSISGDIESNSLENALRTILKMWEPDIAQKKVGDKIIIYRK